MNTRLWTFDFTHRCQATLVRLAIAALAILPLLLGCADKVRFANTSSQPNGILVDGLNSGINANDKTFVSTNLEINVGAFNGSAANNEVIGFTTRRPVAIVTPVGWSSFAELVDVVFTNEIVIPVKVWIVKGPFTTQRDKAIDACITTSSIWDSERMGVRFGLFEIVDATSDPDAPNYFAFDCSKRAGIQSDIGQTSGRINIYYVDTVDGGTGRGQACVIGSDFVAMGSNTGDELLSHELGHDFALTHIDSLSDFDQTNIMHSASNTRQFVTEAQLFRSHLTSNSALNFLYGARPGQPTRDCGRDEDTHLCPRINKRIWADGTFPAN